MDDEFDHGLNFCPNFIFALFVTFNATEQSNCLLNFLFQCS
jgi:hypothetical protein